MATRTLDTRVGRLLAGAPAPAAGDRRLRIAILMHPYKPGVRSNWPPVLDLLTQRGAQVDVIHPEERVFDLAALRVEHDLYVLKEKTDLTLSLGGALHTAGAAILNSFPASIMLRDKVITSRLLEAAGVPAPDSYFAAHPAELVPLLDAGPLVIKPFRGSRGVGVRVVRTADELRDVPHDGQPVYAQRYLPPDGRDRKLYAIGPDVFGVKRAWPAVTFEEKLGEPFPVTGELAELVVRCRYALGIDLFGVDVIESGGRPYVVDASSFPGFAGVPDVPERLARYIYAAAERAARGEPIVSVVSPTPGGVAASGAFDGPRLRFVLNALSATPTSMAELAEICRVLDEARKKERSGGA
jgi:ribosomal protein S6--L-glutamate ligase